MLNNVVHNLEHRKNKLQLLIVEKLLKNESFYYIDFLIIKKSINFFNFKYSNDNN